MGINIIVAIIVGVLLLIALLCTTIYVYISIVKNKKSYSREKSSNGDIPLDYACDKHLSLTNVHVPE